MEKIKVSSRRTDDQLHAVMDETGHWAVNGRQGQALCSAASLQLIDRATQYAASGAVVIAICRQPSDNVIIFAEQLGRLRRTVEVRRVAHSMAA